MKIFLKAMVVMLLFVLVTCCTVDIPANSKNVKWEYGDGIYEVVNKRNEQVVYSFDTTDSLTVVRLNYFLVFPTGVESIRFYDLASEKMVTLTAVDCALYTTRKAQDDSAIDQ